MLHEIPVRGSTIIKRLGVLLSAKDLIGTPLKDANTFFNGSLCDVDTGQLFHCIGTVPFVCKGVVYHVYLKEKHNAKYGWQWNIVNVYTTPPYHDLKLMRVFCEQVALVGVEGVDEKKKTKDRIKTFCDKNKARLANKEWFEDRTNLVAKSLLEKLFLPPAVGEEIAAYTTSRYPLISTVYDNVTKLFHGNKWWSQELRQKEKDAWESELKDAESAFRMAFYCTMPPLLQALRAHPNNDDDGIDEDSERQLFTSTKKRKKKRRGRDSDGEEEEKDNECTELKALMLKVSLWSSTMFSTRWNHVPELSSKGYLTLCNHFRWTNLDDCLTYNPLAKPFLAAIQLYEEISAELSSSQECCCKRLPQYDSASLDLLCKHKVLVVDEHMIFHSLWHQSKKALMTRLDALPKRMSKVRTSETRPSAVEEKIINNVYQHKVSCIIGKAGRGKCLGKGTQVVMYDDGSSRAVENIVVGDKLMGDNGLPRVVTSLARGFDTLYSIMPWDPRHIFSKDDIYVVNSEHIITLQLTSRWVISPGPPLRVHWFVGGVEHSRIFRDVHQAAEALQVEPHDEIGATVDISIRAYKDMSDSFRLCWKGFRAPVLTTPLSCVESITPCLAYLLGSYHAGDASVCRDPLMQHEFVTTKQVLTSTYEARLHYLAGYFDHHRSAYPNAPWWMLTSTPLMSLAELAQLCRSLGFAVFRERSSYLHLYGTPNFPVSRIPTCGRSKSYEQCDAPLVPTLAYDIQIQRCSTNGEYFGFTLDKASNQRFLLGGGSYIVTHNTEMIPLLAKEFSNNSMVVVSYICRMIDVVKKRLAMRNVECKTSTVHSYMWSASSLPTPLVFVIDEVSILSELLVMQLLSVIRFERIVFVGDPNQISAWGFGRGEVLREMTLCFPEAVTELLINWRQKQCPDNLILPNADLILDGEPPKFDQTSFICGQFKLALTRIIDEFRAVNFEGRTFLVGQNRHAAMVNLACMKRMHEATTVGRSDDYILNTFHVGDRVLFTRKNKRSSDNQLDEVLSQDFYRQEGQMEREKNRVLYNRGELDEIVGIVVVEAGESHELAKNCSKVMYEPGEIPASSSLLTLDHPLIKKLISVRQHITRAKYSGVMPKGTLSKKQYDEVCWKEDLRCLLQTKSGRVFSLADQFQSGYAITIHRYQGSECIIAALCVPDYHQNAWMQKNFGRRELYTSVTRPKEKFIYLGTNPARELQQIVANAGQHSCRLSTLKGHAAPSTPAV